MDFTKKCAVLVASVRKLKTSSKLLRSREVNRSRNRSRRIRDHWRAMHQVSRKNEWSSRPLKKSSSRLCPIKSHSQRSNRRNETSYKRFWRVSNLHNSMLTCISLHSSSTYFRKIHSINSQHLFQTWSTFQKLLRKNSHRHRSSKKVGSIRTNFYQTRA